MEKLSQQIDRLIDQLENADNFKAELERLVSVYPFNKYEYILSTPLAKGLISFDDYLQIRDDYINRNRFLPIFEITAPRAFGDIWSFRHLHELERDFQRPTKKTDPNYQGEYDLFLDWVDETGNRHYIKIEVKSSRATDKERPDESIYIKALSSDSRRPFLMNFQQLKPSCCDVFVWIAVYRDKIRYWVIPSFEVQKNKYFTPQHRNVATATRGKGYEKMAIYEGQIMLTNSNIEEFATFEVSGLALKDAVIAQYRKQEGYG